MEEKVPSQDERSKQEYQADVIEDDKNCQVNIRPVMPTVCDDKKSQSTKCYKNLACSDKNCQDTNFMWPVQSARKTSSCMWSIPRPAMLQSSYKKKDQVKSVCSGKNSQETPNVHMWLVKPAKGSSDMWSVEPANYKKIHNDKNCQETSKVHIWPVQPAKKESCYKQSIPRPAKLQSEYKKKNPVKQGSVYFDKNHQESPNVHMWPVKLAKGSSHMQSVTRANNMKSIGPEMLQSGNKQHIYEECSVRTVCDYNKCQSTRCCKKKNPVKTRNYVF